MRKLNLIIERDLGKKIKVFWAHIHLDIACQIKWLIVGNIKWDAFT